MAVQADWMERDLYAVLGVAEDADHKTISRATGSWPASCTLDTHPDDPAAADRFKEVTAAYDVIGDEAKRVRVRRFRRAVAGRRRATGRVGPWRWYVDRGTGPGVLATRARGLASRATGFRAETGRGRHSTPRRGTPSTRKTSTACSAASWDGRPDGLRHRGAARTWRPCSPSILRTQSTA